MLLYIIYTFTYLHNLQFIPYIVVVLYIYCIIAVFYYVNYCLPVK
jgi:hypothetical protein